MLVRLLGDEGLAMKIGITAIGKAIWDDITDHTVTSYKGGFNSGHVHPGARFSCKFTQPGIYSYLCTIHLMLGFGMRGKVIVR